MSLARWAAAGLAVLHWALLAAPASAALLDWSADERGRILQHGPWPPAPARDPGNALAGQPAAIALGQRLFFDPRLSADGALACASCHQPQRAFSDGRPRAMGRVASGGAATTPLDRNTPTLLNTGQQRWWGWDGAFDSLWSQALHPLLHPREMAGDAAHIARLLRSDATLAGLWQQAHGARLGAPAGAPPGTPPGTSPGDTDAALLVPLVKALGAYVATLQSGRTRFDQFRDALARGDASAAARYPLPAQRGLRLFIGRGQCSLCHSGPLFSNGEFADIGALFFARPGVVDPGRHAGISALLASPHNLLGPHADRAAAGPPDPATKTRHVLLQHRNFGEFKVPGLRNVARTAPYLHDGQKATLGAVLDHYSTLSPDRLHADGEQILKPLHFSAGERADLLALLHSLSDAPARPAPASSAPARPAPSRAATGSACRAGQTF